ncbi:MAG: hypothetical protein LBD60_02190 [Puniceicoccales bacterium]|jgi:hypothetical protein|nr:hypothetical protein [Puniceicoccales bacterium]
MGIANAGQAFALPIQHYDLTFKSLFLGMDNAGENDLASPGNANKRLISLLNSLVYPQADNDESKERIVSIEIIDGAILTTEKLEQTQKEKML